MQNIFYLSNVIVVFATAIALIFFFSKKMRSSSYWRATVTPLASIIGSGFLISAPLLVLASGQWALFMMIFIVVFAYAIGSSLRFNIHYVEPLLSEASVTSWSKRIETLARFILGIAYIISIAFYLKFLSVFVLDGLGISNSIYKNILTTALLLLIGLLGKFRGFSMLEFLETYSVDVKLAIIFALLMASIFYNGHLFLKGDWVLTISSHESGWIAFRKVLGMVIIVQGFETSRYIGNKYSAALRIKTMRYAQWISGAIYILFLALVMIIFNRINHITDTAIIELSYILAPVLGVLIIIAAVMSQLSAAIADTVGSGGLLAEATHQKVSVNDSYLFISSAAMVLIWTTNIYQIVSIASKAFAIYYAFEIMLTLLNLKKLTQIKHRILKTLFYTFLFMMMVSVVILGIPVK